MIKVYDARQDNRLLYLCLILSVGFHLLGIAVLVIQRSPRVGRAPGPLRVTYQSAKKHTVPHKPKTMEEVKVLPVSPFVKDSEILNKNDALSAPSTFKIQDISKLPEKLRLSRKVSPTIPALEGERRVSIPSFESEKISTPQYLSYNQSIRERIKQRAYQYVNHPDFKAGNVYLTFILKSDGTLKDIKIIEGKTDANDYLRAIGIRSIKESNPFMPFPANLSFLELTFNVVMSFEMK